MRWWFAASDHQVKIVLLTKLDRAERKITLEKWVGAHLQRTITITGPAAASADPASFTVDGGILLLEFDLLFLRRPIPEEELGMGMDIRDLHEYAAKVWMSGG